MQAELKPDAVNDSANLSHSEIEEEQKKKNRREYFERQARARKAGAAPAHKRQGEEEKPSRRLSLDEMRRLAQRLDDAAEIVQLPDGTHAIQFPDGSTIEDHGDHLIFQGEDYTKGAKAMLEAARAKGWEQIRFWGSDEWRQAAIAEAIRQGFRVSADEDYPQDKELIERLSKEFDEQRQATANNDAQQRAQLLEKFKKEIRQETEKEESTGPRPGM